jgi:hypothetical protein
VGERRGGALIVWDTGGLSRDRSHPPPQTFTAPRLCRAKPPRRQDLGSTSHVGHTQPTPASRRWLETPQTSWRLCAFARLLTDAAHTTPPLDEPSTARATALQLAPSRLAAKSFAELRPLSPRRPEAPPTSPRLCASARLLTDAAHTTPPLDEPSTARETASRTSRRAAEPQSRLSEPSTARETALQLAPSRLATKSFAELRPLSPRRPEAPPTSPRLCASARLLTDAAYTTPPLDEPPGHSAPPPPSPPTFFASPLASDHPIRQTSDVRLPAPGALKPRSLSQHQKHEGPPVYSKHRSARRNKFFWVNCSGSVFLGHLRRPVAPGGAPTGHRRHNAGVAFSTRGDPSARGPSGLRPQAEAPPFG